MWAIQQYGFEAVISPRFGPIFKNNSTKNGLVPVEVSAEVGEALMRAVEADPGLEITIDVERSTVEAPAIGLEAEFPLDEAIRQRFLQGLDDIGLTLRHETSIDLLRIGPARLAADVVAHPFFDLWRVVTAGGGHNSPQITETRSAPGVG